ncbi:MAG: hypothetical protein Q9200_001798 [Gallowayella weberi]
MGNSGCDFPGPLLVPGRRVYSCEAKSTPGSAAASWLLPRSQRQYPPSRQFSFYQHQQNPYEMNAYPPPPPAYHHNEMPPPPRYEPPQGASKTNPDQRIAPSGPPPAGEASNSGSAPPAPGYIPPSSERFDAVPLQSSDAQLPPRPQSSGRSWNPLKRFK